MKQDDLKVKLSESKKSNGIRNIGIGCSDIDKLSRSYVKDVLDSGRLSYGKYIQQVEKDFSKMHNCSFGVMMNSGTDALRIALLALKEVHNWNDGDEVIVPSTTFIATSNIVLQSNMVPVFVDVETDYFEMNPDLIEQKITSKTRAIIPVHLLGCPCEMDKIKAIADKYNLKIIEDSCECMFVKYKGKPVGSWGDIACFSTYMAHIITSGVGGISITNNPEYSRVMRSIMNHGRDGIYVSIDDDNMGNKNFLEIIAKRFRFERLGYSSRITELEGALALAQLKKKDTIMNVKLKNALYMLKNLKKYDKYLQLPKIRPESEHAFMIFGILVKNNILFDKQQLVEYLEKHGIETRDLFPLLTQPIYIKLFGDIEEKKYPSARIIHSTGFYIGCHQKLTKTDLKYVVSVFDAFFKQYELKNK